MKIEKIQNIREQRNSNI